MKSKKNCQDTNLTLQVLAFLLQRKQYKSSLRNAIENGQEGMIFRNERDKGWMTAQEGQSVIDRILKSVKNDGPVTFICHNPQYLDVLGERVERFAREPAHIRKTVIHDKRKNYDTCILNI